MSAAFLLDPVNFRCSVEDGIQLPFDVFSETEEKRVVSELKRVARANSEALIQELSDIKLHGISQLSELNEKTLRDFMLVTETHLPDGSVTRSAVPVQTRVKCWSTLLRAKFPVLSVLAELYLSMHPTSCASERNLSVFGRLYDKLRGKLQLKRAEKMVVSVGE